MRKNNAIRTLNATEKTGGLAGVKRQFMENINWTEVICFVLRLIADGLSQKDAVNKAAMKFNVRPDEVIRHWK